MSANFDLLPPAANTTHQLPAPKIAVLVPRYGMIVNFAGAKRLVLKS